MIVRVTLILFYIGMILCYYHSIIFLFLYLWCRVTSRYTYQFYFDVVKTLIERLATSENSLFIYIDVIFFILKKIQQQNNRICYFSMSIIEKEGFLSNEKLISSCFRCKINLYGYNLYIPFCFRIFRMSIIYSLTMI